MKKHTHTWKEVGYYNAGFGISSNCIIYWCTFCGALYKNRVLKPKVK